MFIPIYENNRFIPWESGQFSVNSTRFNTHTECLLWCEQENKKLIDPLESEISTLCTHLFIDKDKRQKFIEDVKRLVKNYSNDKDL
jgi:hypothetical protein